MSVEKVACLPLLRCRKVALDQARNEATPRKVRFITALPWSQVSKPSRRSRGRGGLAGPRSPEAGDEEGVVGGDEAQRVEALRLHPVGEEEAQRLVRVPAGEAPEGGVPALLGVERLDQHPLGLGEVGDAGLEAEPVGGVARQVREPPGAGSGRGCGG
jgi:hypothetical protein